MLVLLDIDGVMVPAKSWESPEILSDGFYKFSDRAVSVLQKLISEDTTIILTTSHKSRYSIEEWKDIFRLRGIVVNKLDKLEDNVSHESRKDEILNWANVNSLSESLVILDDDKSLNSLPPFLKDKLVLTSSMIGLTDVHLIEIMSKLDKQLRVV